MSEQSWFLFSSRLFPTLFFSLFPFLFTRSTKILNLLTRWLKSQSNMLHWSQSCVQNKLRPPEFWSHDTSFAPGSASSFCLHSCVGLVGRCRPFWTWIFPGFTVGPEVKEERFQTTVWHFILSSMDHKRRWSLRILGPRQNIVLPLPPKHPCF